MFGSETPGRLAHRLRGELVGIRQRKEDEKESQRQATTASLMQHQHQMNVLKSAHSAKMAKMLQSKADSTTDYNAAVAAMNANQRQHIQQHVADHNASMSAMRKAKQGVQVSRNARVNVQKLANQQRLNNVAQQLDAQCSRLKQERHEEARVYSQRMKLLSFSHIGKAKDTQNRNTEELEQRRRSNRNKVLSQQNKAMATNERYRLNLVDEELRHGKALCDMQAANEAKSSKHATTMGRMKHKNKHRNEDMNHMSLQFVAMEDKLSLKTRRLCSAATIAGLCSSRNLKFWKRSRRPLTNAAPIQRIRMRWRSTLRSRASRRRCSSLKTK